MTDLAHAAAFCWLGYDTKDWKATLATLRPLKKIADQLIEINWIFVLGLAGELVKHKTLDQQQIARILKLDQAENANVA